MYRSGAGRRRSIAASERQPRLSCCSYSTSTTSSYCCVPPFTSPFGFEAIDGSCLTRRMAHPLCSERPAPSSQTHFVCHSRAHSFECLPRFWAQRRCAQLDGSPPYVAPRVAIPGMVTVFLAYRLERGRGPPRCLSLVSPSATRYARAIALSPAALRICPSAVGRRKSRG